MVIRKGATVYEWLFDYFAILFIRIYDKYLNVFFVLGLTLLNVIEVVFREFLRLNKITHRSFRIEGRQPIRRGGYILPTSIVCIQ